MQRKVRVAGVLAATAAAVAMMGAPAFASVGPAGNVVGNGNLSIASGNSVYAPVSIPVNACGISLALLGFSNANCVAAQPASSTASTLSASSPSR